MSSIHAAGGVLVFVTRKANSEEVATSLRGQGYQGKRCGLASTSCSYIPLTLFLSVGLLHGDMAQGDRDKVIGDFKRKQFPILVATDVAGNHGSSVELSITEWFCWWGIPLCVARGLDIPYIKTVVNFDVAKDIDTHVHRIGRTGRAGEKGTAFTLLLPKDVNFAGDLVRNLVSANA